jgi:hypothetical protein
VTTCTPLKPFRCWQYRKGTIVPEWAPSGEQVPDGYWYVEQFDSFDWCSPAEFAERFKVTE